MLENCRRRQNSFVRLSRRLNFQQTNLGNFRAKIVVFVAKVVDVIEVVDVVDVVNFVVDFEVFVVDVVVHRVEGGIVRFARALRDALIVGCLGIGSRNIFQKITKLYMEK